MIKGLSVPYDDLDPPVLVLVREINEFPGLGTMTSCGGGEDHFLPPDRWEVGFQLEKSRGRPTRAAWLSLEFLAWYFYDRTQATRNADMRPLAKPPWLNSPGDMIWFMIDGYRSGDGTEPDEVANSISKLRNEIFSPR